MSLLHSVPELDAGGVMMGADGRTSIFGLERITTFQEIQRNVFCPRCELYAVLRRRKLTRRS